MKFTYEAYKNMILNLKKNNYEIIDYKNYKVKEKAVILRHDVDFSLEKALEMAELENRLNVSAIYFVLLSTDFYNVASKKSTEIIKKIINLGGIIGLHFDEQKYQVETKEDLIEYVKYEADILSKIIGEKIEIVSMHRPSKKFLEMNLEIPEMINSYQKEFFENFKYVSDSRMNWRENIEEIINSNKYEKLHILTHPFWYEDKEDTMKNKLEKFLENSVINRYHALDDNLKDLESVISKEEIKNYGKKI